MHPGSAEVVIKPITAPFPNPVSNDGDDDGDGDGRISPEHPSPILHAPRDIISRKGKSLTPMICFNDYFLGFLGDCGPKWSWKALNGVITGGNYSQTPYDDFWTNSVKDSFSQKKY